MADDKPPFRTWKAAFGWLRARQFAGEPRKQATGPHVQQDTPADTTSLAFRSTELVAIAAADAEQLARWYAWAETSDLPGSQMRSADFSRLAAVRNIAEKIGLLRPQFTIPPMEQHTWHEIPDQIQHTSTRAKDVLGSLRPSAGREAKKCSSD